jgi:hypothetical protein
VEDGISRVVGSALGNAEHADVLSGLFVDTVVPELLDRYHSVPPGCALLLVVEGETDKQFIELAAAALGRSDELDALAIVACKGAHSAVAQAVLLRAEAKQPVIALFDSDEEGRSARDLMSKRFGFDKRSILEYRTFVGGHQDAESEWMFPAALMQRFVDTAGEELVLKSKMKHGGEYRYDFTPRGKHEFPIWLSQNAKPKDYERWTKLIDDLSARVKDLHPGEEPNESSDDRSLVATEASA